MDDGVFLELLLILVLLVLNGVLAAAEIALVSARRSHIVERAEANDPNAKAVLRLLGNTSRLLATIQVGVTIGGFLASAVGAVSFVMVLSRFLDRVPIPIVQELSGILAVMMVTLVISFVSIVFGELVPKQLAIRYSEAIALALARPLEWMAFIATPMVVVLTVTSRIVLRIVGLGRVITEERPPVTERDLRLMFDVAATQGDVEEREVRMLHRVFEFTDKLAREVMTPRPEIYWMDKEATVDDFMPVFAESYHARYPICDDDPDNVLGIIYIKDVLQATASGKLTGRSVLTEIARPAYFVPETKRVGDLFEEMRSAGHQLAIIVDEYGGTAGLVTLKQLMEEIVGPVGDEILGQEHEFETIDEHTFQVDGAMRISEVNEALGLELPEGDYETLAGFLLHVLGHIPQVEEQARYHDVRLTIAEMSGVKIEKVRVTRS